MIKNRGKTYPPRGVTLLVTLMVLMILAVVIVQFQVDASLQIRASSYRVERLQCRYAAESGIALGNRIIQQVYNEQIVGIADFTSSDLESLLGLDEPNRIAEPNDVEDLFTPETAPEQEELPWFIMQKKNLEINGVEVDIEIHDENAKYPLVWILTSPFDRTSRSKIAIESLEEYADSLRLNPVAFEAAVDLNRDLGRSLPLPPAPVTYSGTGLRMAPKGRKGNWVQLIAEEQERHKSMGNFARYWYEHFELRRDDPLLQELGMVPVSFADCVSIWGSFHVNINTAPPELLQSVFNPMGISSYQLNALINARDMKTITSLSQLRNIKNLDARMRTNIEPLLVVKSRTYSVHVNARLGRTFCHLISCVHMNHRSEAENLALVIKSGD
ncbi:MAG: hypothetical protein AMJ79_07130 [Phycisphaerae bacterium SM23_30]|nr:MAG: hypothetical protein AMJ79_07130 [Phycisphaerae bacterium SM23_30]